MASIWNKTEEINNTVKGESFGWEISYANNSNTLAVSSPYSNDDISGLTNSGNVKVYDLSDPNNAQLGETISGLSSNQKFGYSIDLSENGKVLAVGSPGDETSNGFVSIYEFDNDNWHPLGNQISGSENNDSFGWSINLSDDGLLVAVGDPHYDLLNGEKDAGSVNIFSFSDSSGEWEEIIDPFFGTISNENLGYTVDLDNDLIAIGSPEKDLVDKNGFVSAYYLNSNEWLKLGNNIVGEKNTDESGTLISIASPDNELDGSLIAIGAMRNDGNNLINSGHVRVYEYDLLNNNWIQKGNDIDGSKVGDLSSYSLDLAGDGDYLSVGSINHDFSNNSDSGQVRVFNFDQNTNIWRQSGFDLGGTKTNENFGSSLSFSDDGDTLAVSSLNGGLNEAGDIQIYNLGETNYSVNEKEIDNDAAILRYSYKLLDSETGEQVTGVNLWTLDDSGEQTIFDEINSQKQYDLLIEAKTTDSDTLWNLESFDLTINLADGVFSEFQNANIEFGDNINFAKSYSHQDKQIFDGMYGDKLKEGFRVSGSIGSEISSTERVNTNYIELFRIKNLSFDQEVERGTENGETLDLNFISNDFNTVLSNYQDTDNNGVLDNAYISSLKELGYDQSNLSFEIDRTNEIYTYQTFAEMVEHGTTLWSQRVVGSNAKTFLIRNGSTVNGRSWWSNVGNFETELDSIVAENLDTTNQLTLVDYGDKINLTATEENTVAGYSVTSVSNDGRASSWDDSTSESFSIDLEVRVNGQAGESIANESFYSIDGDDFKDNQVVENNANLLSRNIITYQGDINYDGRVSLMDLAYLNAGKLYADQNSFIASNDVDANFDGVISVSDIAILEKDFMQSIHDAVDYDVSWDQTKWDTPEINEGETSGLSVGSITEIETIINFDNSAFIQQEILEESGLLNSVNYLDNSN